MNSPMIACASATVFARNSGARVSAAPAPIMWVWLSMRPGMTVLPWRSTTRVVGDAYRRMSSDVPTPTNLPSFTATACTMVNALSTVMMLPLTYTVSALGADRDAHAAMTPSAASAGSAFSDLHNKCAIFSSPLAVDRCGTTRRREPVALDYKGTRPESPQFVSTYSSQISTPSAHRSDVGR